MTYHLLKHKGPHTAHLLIYQVNTLAGIMAQNVTHIAGCLTLSIVTCLQFGIQFADIQFAVPLEREHTGFFFLI